MRTATNGVRGFWAALKQRPDAIISDFHMPAGGHYVLRALKAHRRTKSIPVVFLTGRSDPIRDDELLHKGAVEVLAKPPDFDDLQRVLKACVPASKE